MITSQSSLEDIAFEVCTALHREGVTAVLTGGSAAAVYAPKANTTGDLDFVLHYGLQAPKLETIADLGFVESKTGGTYQHPLTPYTLEFLDGPLAVGDHEIESWRTLDRGDLLLHIISPTDSICDRLAAAIHWHDRNSLQQAAAVAGQQEVDMQRIKSWCEGEGGLSTFELLEAFVSEHRF